MKIHIFKKKKKYKEKIIYIILYKLLLLILSIFILFQTDLLKENFKIFINYFNPTYKYFSCYSAMGRLENLYVRELVEYYKNIGVDKIFLGDHNEKNTEKLSDVLQDYVNNGFVEIIDLIGTPKYSKLHVDFYGYIYKHHKSECNWFMFFDFDEFLGFKGENMTIQKYLSQEKFDKCDVIKVNWLAYTDNDLVYYDNRTLIKRFTQPLLSFKDNKYIKSIVRGNILEPIWAINTNCHQPNRRKSLCDSLGNRLRHDSCEIQPPLYNESYLMHFSKKTAEEYVIKSKRGFPNYSFNYDTFVDKFFELNKFTKEKLNIFEKGFKQTFNRYH